MVYPIHTSLWPYNNQVSCETHARRVKVLLFKTEVWSIIIVASLKFHILVK